MTYTIEIGALLSKTLASVALMIAIGLIFSDIGRNKK